MDLIGKGIEFFSPSRALNREIARMKLETLKKTTIKNQGYGNHGASWYKNATKKWLAFSGGLKNDIYNHKDTLQGRSRDLYMGTPVARGAINTMITNVVGSGLKLKSSIDNDILQKDVKYINQLEDKIEKEFNLWANDKIEQTGLLDFYGVQELVFLTTLLNGECFIHLNYFETPNNPYQLKLNVIEPDRVRTPMDKQGDNTVNQGIQLNEYGRVQGYYVLNEHPHDNGLDTDYTYIPLFDEDNRLNIIHLSLNERPNQLRGVPILAPVMVSLKQLDRYTEAELMSAVVSSMLTVFIESKLSPEERGDFDVPNLSGDSGAEERENELELGNGALLSLNPGETINTVNPSRPNAQFDPFVVSIMREIGTSLGLPYELLVMHFTSSYSASRAALLEAWKTFRKRREWISSNFCQVVFEEWLREAIYIKRVDITGVNDILEFKAYSNALWNGPAQGQIDPLKEANASILKINNGLSTRTREVAELSGGDFEQNIRIIARENEILKEKGVKLNDEINDTDEIESSD